MSSLNELVGKALDTAEDPEQEAIELCLWLQSRYDWTGVTFTRQDVETVVERKLSDEEWESVTATKPWRDTASIILEVGGWEPVYMAIQEAGIET